MDLWTRVSILLEKNHTKIAVSRNEPFYEHSNIHLNIDGCSDTIHSNKHLNLKE